MEFRKMRHTNNDKERENRMEEGIKKGSDRKRGSLIQR